MAITKCSMSNKILCLKGKKYKSLCLINIKFLISPIKALIWTLGNVFMDGFCLFVDINFQKANKTETLFFSPFLLTFEKKNENG